LTAHTKSCNCHTCPLQKASRRPLKGSLVKRASFIGDVIHTDLAGPMPPSISGYKYVQSFIDSRTRLKYIYLLKMKSDAGGTLRDFMSTSNANSTVSSRLCMLTTRQNSLVVISTAVCVSKALSSPALHCTRQSRTDWRKISTKSCLLAHGAFSIMPRWVRPCGARLLTTLCTYSTSHRHGCLVILLHMKLHMEMCLMSASFACLAVQYLRRSPIQEARRQGCAHYQLGTY
jgi:hypothetical protein